MRWLIRIIIVAAIVGYLAYLAGRHFEQAGKRGVEGSAPPVSVMEVIVHDAILWQTFSGRLVAVESAEVRPQVSGIIEKAHFKEGEWVNKGQPLFTIDQRPFIAALQAAEAHATMAQAELARAKTLIAEKAISQRDFDQKKSDAASAQAELTRARLDYDYSVVKAPVAGRIGRAEITAGNLVSAANAPLLTMVVANKPIYADFDIDEQTYLHFLQPAGSSLEKLQAIPVFLGIANEEGEPHEGRMQSFDNQLNIRSGTIRVRTVFANEDGKLLPGLYARVRLGGVEKKNAILITDRAVGTDQNKRFVIVVKEDNTTERREVKLDGMAGDLRVVSEGLKPGEKIVVSGMQRIMMPGQPVKPEIVPIDGREPEIRGQSSGKREQDIDKKMPSGEKS